MTHAHDRIAFAPGARVAVGFSPRPGDGWPVGGVSPEPLPAGRLDGASMRRQGSGPTHELDPGQTRPQPRVAPASDPAAPRAPATATIDLPSNGVAAVLATPASWTAPPTAGQGGVSTDAVVTPSGLRREIFGFLPYWEVNSSSLRLDYSKLSTIAYFGIGADAAGNLRKKNVDGTTTVGWSGWTSSRLTSIISAAHTNHTRVALTIQAFAWNTSGQHQQATLLGSSTARLNLARQIVAAVRDRGVDGVNLDFEPLATGYATQFTALVRTLRSELNKIHAGYQITFDTTGSIGNYPIEAATAAGGADAIFVMGYDYRTAGSSPVGSIAPYEKAGYDIVDTVRAYMARVPASRLILGVPYYGRAWSTSGNGLNATNISGAKYGSSTSVTYDTAADYLAQDGRSYDTLEEVAWTAYRRQNCTTTYGCVTAWRELYVDDAAALGRKYDLVNSYGLRGAGIWALGYDGTRPDLWRVIQAKFITDTVPPTVSLSPLASRQTNPEFPVSWTGRDASGIRSYDVQVAIDGGGWTPWLSGATLTRAVYDGDDGHAYRFRVRARDSHNNVSAWVAGSTAVHGVISSLAFNGHGVSSLGTSSAALGERSFSPNADGRLDQLGIGWTNSSTLDSVRLRVFRADGSLVGEVTLAAANGQAGGHSVSWNGSVGGHALPDGRYLVSLIGRVGTPTRVYYDPVAAFRADALSAYGVVIDRVPPTVTSASISGAALSPNGDGVLDSVRVAIAGSGSTIWSFAVARVSGTAIGAPVLSRTGAGSSVVQTWTGLTGAGLAAADGTYRLSLSLTDAAGNRATRSWSVRVDRLAPTVRITAPTRFSPNADGAFDTASIGWSSSEVLSGSVRVYHGSTLVRAWPIVAGASGSFTWNGKNAGGVTVPDGSYVIRLTGRDTAGNAARAAAAIVVDRSLSTLRWAPTAFFPQDGDALAARSTISVSLARAAVVRAGIYSGSTLVRTIWSNRSLGAGRHGWTWDGRNAVGALVPRGAYLVRVSATTTLGVTGLTRSILVDAFATTLSSATVRAGQTLTITFTSVEPLRFAPSVTFGQPGRAIVTRRATSLGSGRFRVSFLVAAGPTGVATIGFAGRDTSGGLNRSTRTVVVH